MNLFFSFKENSQFRYHFKLELNKPHANKSIRLNPFPVRNIPVRNSLPSVTETSCRMTKDRT